MGLTACSRNRHLCGTRRPLLWSEQETYTLTPICNMRLVLVLKCPKPQRRVSGTYKGMMFSTHDSSVLTATTVLRDGVNSHMCSHGTAAHSIRSEQ